MADKILVSVQEMEATINRYTDSRNTMENARQHMEKALDNLNNCWKGPAWAAMMAQWQLINANIKNSDMAIGRSINGLKSSIATYEQHESEITAKANALEVGKDSTTYV